MMEHPSDELLERLQALLAALEAANDGAHHPAPPQPPRLTSSWLGVTVLAVVAGGLLLWCVGCPQIEHRRRRPLRRLPTERSTTLPTERSTA